MTARPFRVNRYVLAGATAWTILLVHFALNDTDALLLSVVLTPILGLLLVAAFRARHVVLSIFMTLALFSHAIAPPFFFMKRQFYVYGGSFGAVKDFRFGVLEFFEIYFWVLVFLVATCVATLAMARWLPRADVLRGEGLDLASRVSRRTRQRATWALMVFVLLVCIPLSLFMYSKRIGITGVEPTVLPFRMTGIMSYFRMFIVPAIIFVGYALSNQRWPVAASVLVYAFFGGIAASSRYIVMLSAAPLAIFALVRHKTARLIAVMLAAAVIFVFVTETRLYVYSGAMPYTELLQRTVDGYDMSEFGPFETLGGIANRLWGPQDVVLAYQYRTPDQWTAIGRYFTGQIVVEDITYEFYGMVFSGQSAAWGVGIGYIPWMVLLADRNLAILLLLALVTAALLTASEAAVKAYLRAPEPAARNVAQPLAFFIVYVLYTSTLHWWVDAIGIAIAGLLLLRVYRGNKLARERNAAAPVS